MAASKNKKPSLKNSLASPYLSNWPKLEKGDNKDILDEIRRVFPPLRIRREKKDEDSGICTENIFDLGWEDIKISLVVGVNEVTKALEKDKLMLVLVCKSAKPSTITNHLMLLSATRLTPACGIFGLSEVMAPLLGIKSVAACGFKKDITAQVLKDLVQYIVCKTPQLSFLGEQVWNHRTQEHSPHKETMLSSRRRTRLKVENISKEVDYQKNESTEIGLLGENPVEKLNTGSVNKLCKRSFGSSYIESHVKTLLPSERNKVKKTKNNKANT